MAFIPFAATVGSMIGASGAGAAAAGGMAIASTALAAGGIAASLASSSAQSKAAKKASEMNALLPTTPSDVKTVAAEQAKQVKAGFTGKSTILTGPLGLMEAAKTDKKSLLGE